MECFKPTQYVLGSIKRERERWIKKKTYCVPKILGKRTNKLTCLTQTKLDKDQVVWSWLKNWSDVSYLGWKFADDNQRGYSV